MTGPFRIGDGGVLVAVRLTPGASRDRVGPVETHAAGPTLKVAVTPPPEDGKANRRLVELLAKEWRLAKSNLSVVGGLAARDKTVLVAGAAAELMTRLNDWCERTHG